jgi:hypothetical protein
MRTALASLLLILAATPARADGTWGSALTLVDSCPATPPAVSSTEPCIGAWVETVWNAKCAAGVTIRSGAEGVAIDHDGLSLTLETGPGVVKTRRTTSGLCIYVTSSNGADFTLTRFVGDAPKLQVESGGENRVVIAVNATGLGVWNQPLNRTASKLVATATNTFMDYTDDAIMSLKWQPSNILTMSVQGFVKPLVIDVPTSTLFDPNRWTSRLGGNCWEFTADGIIGSELDAGVVIGVPKTLCRQFVATAPFTLTSTLVMAGTNGTVRLFNASIGNYVQ